MNTARIVLPASWSEVELTEAGVERAVSFLQDECPELSSKLDQMSGAGMIDSYTYFAAGCADGVGTGVVAIMERPAAGLSLDTVESFLSPTLEAGYSDVTSSRRVLPVGDALVLAATATATQPDGSAGTGQLRLYAVINDEMLYEVMFACLDEAGQTCLRDAEAMMQTFTTVPWPASAAVPKGWRRMTSRALGYSIALPGWSYLYESIEARSPVHGPYDQWFVQSSPQTREFGLIIGTYLEPTGGATLAPVEGGETVRVDGATFQVFVPDNPFGKPIDVTAKAVWGDQLWQVMGEAGDIVDNDAKRSLFRQILPTFRFPSPDFVPPAPSASPTG